MRLYAGIGNVDIPDDYRRQLVKMGWLMASKGFVLRSGGAAGSDSAFEEGCDQFGGAKEIFTANSFLPHWTVDLVHRYHPHASRMRPYVFKLMQRNCLIILGENETTPVETVLCYNAKKDGGTTFSCNLAEDYNIPICNIKGVLDVTTKLL